MSLTVKALNNDTSFMLTFSPKVSSPKEHSTIILLDPWLNGPAITISPTIASLTRASGSSVTTLRQLSPQPDLICISQNAADHCHPHTLQTMSRDTSCRILAPPRAATKIRSWKHFSHASAIVALTYFDQKDPYNSAFAFCKSKEANDRNRAARSDSKLSSLCCINETGTVEVQLIAEAWDLASAHTLLAITYTPPTESIPSISVLYCPHGALPGSLTPFVNNLPESTRLLLMHSCNLSKGPWFFGSPTYVYGVVEGVEVAKAISSSAWIRAHDEEKSPTGIATTGVWGVDIETAAVRKALDEAGLGSCEFVALSAGECWNFPVTP